MLKCYWKVTRFQENRSFYQGRIQCSAHIVPTGVFQTPSFDPAKLLFWRKYEIIPYEQDTIAMHGKYSDFRSGKSCGFFKQVVSYVDTDVS